MTLTPQAFPVLHASMSGNSQHLAETIAQWLGQPGAEQMQATAETTDLVTLELLCAIPSAIFVIPTWGQGEVPAPAEPLYHALRLAPAGSLTGLVYGLVAPGDRSYPDYCGGARLFGQELDRCGARRVGVMLCLDGIPMERHYQQVMGWLGGVRAPLAEAWRATTAA